MGQVARGRPMCQSRSFAVRLAVYKTPVTAPVLLGPARSQSRPLRGQVYSAPPHGATGRVPETQTAEGQWRSTSKETLGQ